MVCFKTTWAALPGCPASRHFLGPRDMPFKANRCRHVAVAIPEVRVSRVIAVCPRTQCPQPQQQDFAAHSVVGWRVRQPGESRQVAFSIDAAR